MEQGRFWNIENISW